MPNYEQLARNAARAAGIPEDLFVSQIRAESGFNPNARSPAGALGIAQIMPATAKGWGVDPMNPGAALNAAARAMAKYVNSYGSYRDALVAYNAGPGRVGKPLYAETAAYINRIMGGKGDVSKATPQKVGGAGVAGVQGHPVTAAQKILGLTQGADPRANRLAYIFKDRGRLGEIFKDRAEASAAQGYEGSGVEQSAPAQGGDPKPGSKDWRWLQRIAQQEFGLVNDPGTNQTTGGSHTAGSRHYAGAAIDFGNARNSEADLQRWYEWALANRNKYGFSEVLYESRGTPNEHVHVAF